MMAEPNGTLQNWHTIDPGMPISLDTKDGKCEFIDSEGNRLFTTFVCYR